MEVGHAAHSPPRSALAKQGALALRAGWQPVESYKNTDGLPTCPTFTVKSPVPLDFSDFAPSRFRLILAAETVSLHLGEKSDSVANWLKTRGWEGGRGKREKGKRRLE